MALFFKITCLTYRLTLGVSIFFPTEELSCFDSNTADYFKQDFGDGNDLSWDPNLCEQSSQ